MLVFGHRGASGYAPENTLASFDLAIRQGCAGLECDAQLTRDGDVVIHHDWAVDRTTNGSGEIRDLTCREIRALDAGGWFSEAFRGEKVPTLDELLDRIPPAITLNVELKSRPGDRPGLEERVAAILRTHRREETVIVSSFNHESLRRIGKTAPSLRLGMLYEALLIDPLSYAKTRGLNLYSLHPAQEYASPELVEDAHAEGVTVACWTVNTKKRADELKSIGVDVIITNYPDRCLDPA